jgi:NHLM bacteriocin system ABC transporter peptidase/ATP-binding protein
MEGVECGAAALAIILAYHGRVVPLEEMRVACGVSRDGSKASRMLAAARAYGLEAKGFKKEPESLKAVKPPFIVFWSFNHFLVVEGFEEGFVRLNDPASGPRRVTAEDFDLSFTGIVLTFEPTPAFTKGGEFPSVWKALRSRLVGSEAALAFVVLVGLALVIPGLVVPAFTKAFVDEVLVGNREYWFKPLLLAMGITTTVQCLLTWIQQSYLLRLETKLALTSSSRFFWHVLRLPLEFFSQRFAGDLSQRVSSNDRVAQLLSGELATNVINVVQILFFAAVMLTYDVTLTLVGILIVGLNIAAVTFVARKRKDGNRRLLQEQGKQMGMALGGLQMIETLKASGAEGDFFTRWSGYQAKVVNAQQEVDRYTQFLNAVPTFLTAVTTAVILGFGGFRVMEGAMTMGALVAFQSLMSAFTGPVTRLVALASSFQEIEGTLTRLDDVARYPMDAAIDLPEPELGEGELSQLTGLVELQNLTFGYSRLEEPLITGFSVTIRPGSRVAIVGGSGSGKSTVAKLVCGLYEPWTGEIRFDGRKRREVPRLVLANSLAFVDQDILLFEGSIRDNITLWDTTISLSTAADATRDAAIHEDLASRPGGVDSPVEEAGANFSGGQRQRLEIARALAQNPTILVLDEATSALDATTEKLIDDAIRRRGCTCLIIAHRLSTIRDADEIIVLEKGKIVQRGTHEEMKNLPGTYAQLIGAE